MREPVRIQKCRRVRESGDGMSGLLLDVTDLNIEFHDHSRPETVVHDFDLMLEEGEIVGIVGESGSGKSMSAMAVAGLLSRHEIRKQGKILYDGRNLLDCDRETLRRYQGEDIAVIFQEPMTSLDPVKKIGWQVEESVRLHHPETPAKERRAMAIRCLEDSGLPEPEKVYGQYPFELSGGMRQRVMIAAAMMGNPRILIADEPTTALDVLVQEQIIELLRRIHRERGTAILFISHDLSLVRRLCSRVLVMQHGRIVESGRTEEVFFHPQDSYTRKLVSAIPRVEPGVRERSRNTGERTEPVLTVERLSLSYREAGGPLPGAKRHPALKNISFTLHRGECLALVGGSGCGKTTLARAAVGMLRGDSGCVELHGNRAQMVFQDPYSALNPARSVRWILEEPLRTLGVKDAGERTRRVLDMADRVRLERELLDRYPGQLSGGQRQRVCIAAALMQKPDILVADEPVSALDVTIQLEILALLRALQKEMNLSILFISHDLRTVYQLCDTIMVMEHGEVVESGSVDAVYARPQSDCTRGLLRAAGIQEFEAAGAGQESVVL